MFNLRNQLFLYFLKLFVLRDPSKHSLKKKGGGGGGGGGNKFPQKKTKNKTQAVNCLMGVLIINKVLKI